MAREQSVEERVEERRIRRANMLLERMDQILEDMIDQIVLQKDEEDARTGRSSIVDGRATTNFINKINALHIDGDKDILVAINDKYDNAIKALKAAMKEEDAIYKAQFKNELDKIMQNKSERYDSIAETYKELSDRLDKGEMQRDYFQDKADKKQAEIDVKEGYYKNKIGNADEIAVTLEPEEKELAEKEEFKQKYEKLVKLNRDIEQVENDLKNPDLEEEDKEKLEHKLERLKEERQQAVEEFSTIAKDKDGKKYEKPEGKSDKDYIDEIDKNRVDEAVIVALQAFNGKISAMDSDKKKITELDKDLNEVGELDISKIPVTDHKSAKELLNKIALQKRLWRAKMERDGFDKAKLKREKQEFQDRADSYDEEVASYDDEDRYPVVQEKFDWRHPIQSIKNLFQRRKNQNVVNNDFDIEKTKKEALKYLEKNTGDLAKIKTTDRKNNKDKFLNNLRYNVSVSQEAINKFWDREETKNKEDKGKEGR